MKMIQIENIVKTYRNGKVECKALKGVSFNIQKGEFVAILGPSGSGKSTLMNILGCLDNPTSGNYFLDGKDISKLSEDELADIRKKKLGFVFQTFNLLPRATVMKNVVMPLIYEKVSRKKRIKMAEKVLSKACIDKSLFYHLSNQLSGGQMQRVAIARALVNDPALILADEPTGNLDSKTGEHILKTFLDLNKQGSTIILITHDIYIAKKAKRIIYVKDGSIIDDSPAGESRAFKEFKE